MKTIMDTLNGHNANLVYRINKIYDKFGEDPLLSYIDEVCPNWGSEMWWSEGDAPDRRKDVYGYISYFLEEYCDDQDLREVIKFMSAMRRYKVRITYTFSDTFEVIARDNDEAVDFALCKADAKDLDDFEEQDGESEIL